MRSVIAVTHPRSGYHLVARCLKRLFRDIGVNATWKRQDNECYVDDEQVLFLSHDFELNREVDEAQAYLVMYRHPIMSIASLVEYVCHGRKQYASEWARSFERRLEFWKRHVRKWGFDRGGRHGTNAGRREVVLYEDLVADPVGQLLRIMGLFGEWRQGACASAAAVAAAAAAATGFERIRQRRTMEAMPYVSDEDIDRAHEVAGSEMSCLGITDERSGVHYGNPPMKIVVPVLKRSPRRHPRRYS